VVGRCNVDYYHVKWAEGDARIAHGQTVVYTSNGAPENYSTSVIGNKSLAFVRDVVEKRRGRSGRVPFFVWLGPHAPHLPSTPAPWYLDHPIGELSPPREAYWNASGEVKHAFLPSEPIINRADAKAIQAEYSKRMRSLLSVDDLVRGFHTYLVSVGEWAHTFFVWTSDHGYNLGQFRVDSHKTQVYDHCTRIPFVIRGPGIAPGSVLPQIASMVDLAPTLLDLSGAADNVSVAMDGVSFVPWLLGTASATTPRKEAALLTYQSIRTTPVATLTAQSRARDDPDEFCERRVRARRVRMGGE
jgi:N-acetylglucosamine-6-sulfatase